MMAHKDLAAIWLASGEQYTREADGSAELMALHMPHVARYLFTPDENYYVTHFDVTEKLPARAYDNWFLDSVRYTGYALEHVQQRRVVVVDTDVKVRAPFPEVYEMLWRFDMVGVQANPDVQGETQFTVPACFPEIDVGFIGWRKNDVTVRFIQDWWKLFEEFSGQAAGFRTEDECVVVLQVLIEGAGRSLGGHRPQPALAEGCLAGVPVGVAQDAGVFVIIEAGAAQGLVGQIEAERLDEMEFGAGIGA